MALGMVVFTSEGGNLIGDGQVFVIHKLRHPQRKLPRNAVVRARVLTLLLYKGFHRAHCCAGTAAHARRHLSMELILQP